MIRYAVRHRTRFDYDAPMSHARCNLRLRPLDGHGQHVLAHELRIDPAGILAPARAPIGVGEVQRLTLTGPTRGLTIEATALVAVDRRVPIPGPDDPCLAEVATLALASRDLSAAGPAVYLHPTDRLPIDPAIADWCAPDLAPDRPALDAGIALARRIQRDFAYAPGTTHVDTPPARAFAERRGVCQDFAQVMVSGLRAAGLPAAYASGYLRTLPPPGRERLVGADATHAWAMLWCGDRLGWIGLDPTNGIFMAADHVLLCFGRDYGEAAPVDGVLIGSGEQAMTVGVDVAPVADADPGRAREPAIPC